MSSTDIYGGGPRWNERNSPRRTVIESLISHFVGYSGVCRSCDLCSCWDTSPYDKIGFVTPISVCELSR